MRVGVLGLQGCIDPHLNHLRSLGAHALKVRTVKDLNEVDRIILPGGESTTMLKLLHSTNLFSALIKFGQTKPIWGICAGAILLAKRVTHPEQESLEMLNICAERNHYGSQLNSFEASIAISVLDKDIKVQFIRAPLLSRLDDSVEVLAKHNNQEVLLKQGNLLASAFHVELGEDSSLHEYFLSI